MAAVKLSSLLACVSSVHGINVAVANIRAATGADTIHGVVRFEQDDAYPLADVTVTVNVTGLSVGEHGFHVHQYGDVRTTSDLSTMSAHFVPNCLPPELNLTSGELVGGCPDDQKHGLPPSTQRQPGDMGNVVVTADTTVLTIVLGQQKMSLSDGLRSIVGRTVVFHSLRDDGSQPYGNAGAPHAFGVIGIASPAAGPAGLNACMAPSNPPVDKVVCTFAAPTVGSTDHIYGVASLVERVPYQPDIVSMQATLYGLSPAQLHSFHFHTWGDMTVPYGLLGPIYHSAVDVNAIGTDPTGASYFAAEFALPQGESLRQHVGRSLTLHAGASASTPTVAAAVCGLANPSLQASQAPLPGGAAAHTATSGLSGGAAALLALSIIFASGLVAVGVLYYMRCPIPLCGRWLYSRELVLGSMPPPPPLDPTYAQHADKHGENYGAHLRQEHL